MKNKNIKNNGGLSCILTKKLDRAVEKMGATPYTIPDIKEFDKITDAVKGDTVIYFRPNFSGYSRNSRVKLLNYNWFAGEIIKDNYSQLGQHTFTIKISGSETKKLIKGRNLYENCYLLISQKNRQAELENKHIRGKEIKQYALKNWLKNNLTNHPRYGGKLERLKRLENQKKF